MVVLVFKNKWQNNNLKNKKIIKFKKLIFQKILLPVPINNKLPWIQGKSR